MPHVGKPVRVKPTDHPDWHWEKTKPVLARRYRTVPSRRALVSRALLHNHTMTQHSYAHINMVSSKGHTWGRHGAYLQMKGKQQEGENGQGFNGEHDDLSMGQTLRQWQSEGDGFMFRGYISPTTQQHGEMKDHARNVIASVEKELGQTLQWAGIDHNDTQRPHVHLVIRGIDTNGLPLRLNEQQLGIVLRSHSENDLTNKVGYRLVHEELRARAAFVKHERWTTLDDEILRRVNPRNEVHYPEQIGGNILDRERDEHARQRLRFLTERYGVATEIDDTRWELTPDAKQIVQRVETIRQYSVLHRQHQEVIHPQTRIERKTLQQNESLTARVVAEGEVNPHTHTRYVLLEQGKKVLYVEVQGTTHTAGEVTTVKNENGQVREVTEDHSRKQTQKQQEEDVQKRTHTQAVRIDLTEMVREERKRTRGRKL